MTRGPPGAGGAWSRDRCYWKGPRHAATGRTLGPNRPRAASLGARVRPLGAALPLAESEQARVREGGGGGAPPSAGLLAVAGAGSLGQRAESGKTTASCAPPSGSPDPHPTTPFPRGVLLWSSPVLGTEPCSQARALPLSCIFSPPVVSPGKTQPYPQRR